MSKIESDEYFYIEQTSLTNNIICKNLHRYLLSIIFIEKNNKKSLNKSIPIKLSPKLNNIIVNKMT